MANSRDKRILNDGFRNANVSITGVLDTSDENWPSVFQLSDFRNNDPGYGPLVGFRIMGIDFALTDPLTGVISWNSDSPQLISAVSQSDYQNFEDAGGKKPDRTISGFDGAINFKTVGFVPGSPKGYTITLFMQKIYSQ